MIFDLRFTIYDLLGGRVYKNPGRQLPANFESVQLSVSAKFTQHEEKTDT
jgi:hypothetical protein